MPAGATRKQQFTVLLNFSSDRLLPELQTEDKPAHRKKCKRFVLALSFKRKFHYKSLEEPFSAPLKHFCLLRQLTLTVPYVNTLLCVVLTHFVCSLYGILAVRTPTMAVSSSACVFHRLTACRQDFVYTLQLRQITVGACL